MARDNEFIPKVCIKYGVVAAWTSQNTDFILIEAAIVDALCSDLIRKSRPTASTSRSTGPDPTLTTWSFFRSRSTTRDTIINMFFSTPASLLNLDSNSNPNPNPNPSPNPNSNPNLVLRN